MILIFGFVLKIFFNCVFFVCSWISLVILKATRLLDHSSAWMEAWPLSEREGEMMSLLAVKDWRDYKI